MPTPMPDDDAPDPSGEPEEPPATDAAAPPPAAEPPSGCSPPVLLLSCAGLTVVTMIVAGSIAYAGWWVLTELAGIDPWPFG